MIYLRSDLRILTVQGPDARRFLNGLITQRTDLPPGSGSYAAILSPQGKLLADFPLLFGGEELLVLALPAPGFDALVKKLIPFRLKSHVAFSEDRANTVVSSLGSPALAYADPRHPTLSHELRADPEGETATSFHTARARLGIPEGSYDLQLGKSTLINEGLPCAIDWDKGCYMGQEVTARMRYRGLIKRVLVPYKGQATPDQTLRQGNQKVGAVRSSYGDCGFAYVRKEFAKMEVDGLRLGGPIGLADLGL